MTPEAEQAYMEDLAMSLKITLLKEEQRAYYLRHILDEEESKIPDHIDRTPRPDNFHSAVKITPAFLAAFPRKIFKQLIP